MKGATKKTAGGRKQIHCGWRLIKEPVFTLGDLRSLKSFLRKIILRTMWKKSLKDTKVMTDDIYGKNGSGVA